MTKLKNRSGNILIRGTALTSSFSIENIFQFTLESSICKNTRRCTLHTAKFALLFFFLFSRKGNQSKRHTE